MNLPTFQREENKPLLGCDYLETQNQFAGSLKISIVNDFLIGSKSVLVGQPHLVDNFIPATKLNSLSLLCSCPSNYIFSQETISVEKR